jgi:hypothetical protein
MVKNEDGLVAIRYKQPAPKSLKIEGKMYIWDVRHAVSIAWIPENLVPAVLAQKGGCCGRQQFVFSLATDGAVRTFLTGER